MKRKQFIMNIFKPVNIPLTRFVLKRHYHKSMDFTAIGKCSRVLVLAPHMDDETIGPGGVIRKHADEGAEVHCAFVTDGSNSVSNLNKEELTHARMNEMEEVKQILGISSIHYMGLPDGQVVNNQHAQNVFHEIIDKVQPDIIYSTSFVDAHPDHTATAEILADVLNEKEVNPVIRLYEINCPIPPTFINCIMDISDTIAMKAKATEAFSSQTIAFDGFLELNKLKTNLVTKKSVAAEVFLELNKSQLQQHCSRIKNYRAKLPRLFKQANRTDTLLWAIYKNYKLKKRLYQMSLKTGDQ